MKGSEASVRVGVCDGFRVKVRASVRARAESTRIKHGLKGIEESHKELPFFPTLKQRTILNRRYQSFNQLDHGCWQKVLEE